MNKNVKKTITTVLLIATVSINGMEKTEKELKLLESLAKMDKTIEQGNKEFSESTLRARKQVLQLREGLAEIDTIARDATISDAVYQEFQRKNNKPTPEHGPTKATEQDASATGNSDRQDRQPRERLIHTPQYEPQNVHRIAGVLLAGSLCIIAYRMLTAKRA